MLRYFFTFFFLAVIAVIAIAGFRGEKGGKAPIQVFLDMDDQPKFRAQHKSDFFADGRAARQPVAGAIPQGMVKEGEYLINHGNNARTLGSAHSGFTDGTDYVNTGRIGEVWGNGVPVEVSPALLARGQERYAINCAMCHGAAGDGQGIVSKYGLGGITNFHDSRMRGIPDGSLFDTITHGKGNMGAYGSNITVEDRWAIIAYLRALQRSQFATLEDVPAEHRTQLEKQ